MLATKQWKLYLDDKQFVVKTNYKSLVYLEI